MAVRKDAGLALAKFCVAIDAFTALCGPRTVWTTGRITLDPARRVSFRAGPNVVSDPRRRPRRDRPAGGLAASITAEATAQGPCGVAVERLRTGAPANGCRISGDDRAASAALPAENHPHAQRRRSRCADSRHDHAGGHAVRASIGGISHHWTENTDDADIVTGAEVFVDACRRLLAG